MPNIVVVGAQWGDEGKGKLVDLLAKDADVLVRFQGGNNAGHTVVVRDEEFILHLIPSGALHPGKKCLIGNGVVLDPEVFRREVDAMTARGISLGPDRLMLSPRTHLIMPYHKRLDAAREMARCSETKIGTTGRGIGPCYEDKAARVGVRAGDLAFPELLRDKIERALAEKNALFTHLYGTEPMTTEEVMEEITAFSEGILPHLADISGEIKQAGDNDLTVLFEGAQGAQLDIDHGTYPFVTSSNTVASGAATGSGCSARALERIIAIAKAYSTRVGAGPFPTELHDETGDYLQGKGAEFGATTGRKRRCGWLDLVILRETVRLNGPTEIALTKLDVLSGLKEIKICVAYEYQGRRLEYPPQEENALAGVTPVYETLPGWDEDITQATSWVSLPLKAREYVKRIERLLETPVGLVSVGPERSQTLLRK